MPFVSENYDGLMAAGADGLVNAELRGVLGTWTQEFSIAPAGGADGGEEPHVIRNSWAVSELLYCLVRGIAFARVVELTLSSWALAQTEVEAAWFVEIARSQAEDPLNNIVGRELSPALQEEVDRLLAGTASEIEAACGVAARELAVAHWSQPLSACYPPVRALLRRADLIGRCIEVAAAGSTGHLGAQYWQHARELLLC